MANTNKTYGIDKYYQPSEKEVEMRRMVYDRYWQMQSSPERQRMEREWEKGERAWEAFREEKLEEDWQSDYYIPLTTSVIESILAEFIDQRLRPFILPRSDEDEVAARVMQHIFDYTCDVGDFDLELYNVFKAALIRGTGLAQEYYLKDRRLVKDIIDLGRMSKKNKKLEFETKDREVFEYDDVKMEEVSVWDVFVDEFALDFNRGNKKARDCIRRYVMDIEVFKQFFVGPIWNPLGNAQYVKPGGDTNYYRHYKPPMSIDHSKQVEVLWYWSRKPEDLLVIVANDVVVRMGPNIFKHKQLPFAKAVDVSRLDHFYGKGEPKLLESVQEELNTIRRMTIDRHHLDLDKSFLVSNTTQLDDTDLIARPHAVIPVDDINNVKALEYGDIPSSVRITTQAIAEDSIRVTGVDDRAQALQKAGATATEAAILKESTLKRIKMKIILLSRGFLTDISRQRVANIMQFYSIPKLEKIAGEPGTTEFRRAVEEAEFDELLEVKNGDFYRKTYRQIPLQNKNFTFDARGNMVEEDRNGIGFLEARPSFFMPSNQAGFILKYEATSNLQISKPLLQSKTTELFDRLLPLTQSTNYDAEKLGDMLVRVNDFNPEDLKKGQPQQEGMGQEGRIELAVQLAARENQEVLRGEPIPMNGTPFAPEAHTEVHIAALQSPAYKNIPEEQYKKLVQHAMGEIIAQQMRRGGGMGAEEAVPPAEGQPTETVPSGQTPTNEMGNVMPDRVQGGAQVPNGLPFGPAR